MSNGDDDDFPGEDYRNPWTHPNDAIWIVVAVFAALVAVVMVFPG